MAALNSVATAALLRSSWLPGGSISHRRRFGAAAGCPRAPGRRGAPVSPRELKQQASYRTKCTLYPLLANCKRSFTSSIFAGEECRRPRDVLMFARSAFCSPT